jgi:hypothetical protein
VRPLEIPAGLLVFGLISPTTELTLQVGQSSQIFELFKVKFLEPLFKSLVRALMTLECVWAGELMREFTLITRSVTST